MYNLHSRIYAFKNLLCYAPMPSSLPIMLPKMLHSFIIKNKSHLSMIIALQHNACFHILFLKHLFLYGVAIFRLKHMPSRCQMLYMKPLHVIYTSLGGNRDITTSSIFVSSQVSSLINKSRSLVINDISLSVLTCY